MAPPSKKLAEPERAVRSSPVVGKPSADRSAPNAYQAPWIAPKTSQAPVPGV